MITEVEHGARFAARAADASLLGLVTLALFVTVFARAARTRGWAITLASAWLACLAGDLVLSTVLTPPLIGLALAGTAIGLAALLLPAPASAGEQTPTRPPRWDLPARALATAALVLGVTGGAAALGPGLTGVLAPFPIATSVIAAFALAQDGSTQAIALLRGFVGGLVGFAAFCFLLSSLLLRLGAPASFAIAFCGAVAVQLIARWAARIAPSATVVVSGWVPSGEPARSRARVRSSRARAGGA